MEIPTLTFLLVSFLVGIYAARRVKGSVRNYFVGGNVIPFWVLAFSMSGQAIELGGTHDNANLAMTLGFWDGAILPVGIGISLILLGIFFARPLHGMRLLTLPDFYTVRYNGTVGALVAIICVISFIILVAGNLAGMGIILELALGLPPHITVPAIACLVMIYTMSGGLFAVTWNDVLQVSVCFVGFTAAIVWVFMNCEPAAAAEAWNTKFSWLPLTSTEHGSVKVWASLLALALGDIIALDFMERVFAARTARAAQLGCVVSGVVTIAFGVGLAVMGMLASAFHIGGNEPSTLLAFADGAMPQGIKMLFLMGLLGAGLSTIDGAIMACSVALSRNVLQFAAPKIVTQKRLLSISRLMALPVSILGVVLAIVFPVPGDLLILAFDVAFAGCLVPLALGLYWKGGTTRAALWAIIVPSVLRVVLHFCFADLGIDKRLDGIQTLIPPVLSLVLFIGISKLGRCAARKTPEAA